MLPKNKTNKLTVRHKEALKEKAVQLLQQRFHSDESWKSVWFSNEACINVSPCVHEQNEHTYRSVNLMRCS